MMAVSWSRSTLLDLSGHAASCPPRIGNDNDGSGGFVGGVGGGVRGEERGKGGAVPTMGGTLLYHPCPISDKGSGM
jgi:hypothetical protein